MMGVMRAAFVVLALAVLAGLLWFLRDGFVVEPLTAPQLASEGTRSPTEGEPHTASDNDTRATAPRRDVVAADSSDPSPTTAATPRLQVRVRNAAGRPVGMVPVRADLGGITPGRTEVRPTGPDGIATFPLAPPEAKSDAAPITTPIPIALELATFEPIRADVPAATIARDEVFDLTLPPCGVIAVRLMDLDGQPARGAPVRISLRPLAPRETLADADRRAGISATTDDGAIEFAFVPLHSAFALVPSANGLRASFARARVLGPTTDGQRVEVVLREDATAACVVVRLVDPAHAPLRDTTVRIGLHETVRVGDSSGITTTETTDTTDHDGELRLWFDAAGAIAPVRRITFTPQVRPEASDPTPTGNLTLEHALQAGVTHLGDVVLDVNRTVALAGRVVDEHDAPVADARLEISRISRFASGGQAHVGVDVDVCSADDGAFELRVAEPADSEFAVSAQKDGYLASGAVEARFGTADLRVRLQRAGSITGSLTLDAADQDLVGIRARYGNPPRTREPRLDAATGAFTFESLAAGTYEVDITLRGVGRPILSVPDVVVRAGEATADPRLQAVSLPAGLHRVRVLVQDSAGRALADAVVRADEPADLADRIRLQEHGGDGITMLAPAGTTFVASAAGFRSQAFTPTDATHTVRLLPGVPLQVRVVGDYATVHPDVRLAVSAAPTGATQTAYFLRGKNRSTSGSTRGLDALFVGGAEIPARATSTVLLLPAAGRWTIGLQAIAATGGMRITTKIQGDSTQEVTVSETGGEVTLRLTADAVRAALPK